MVYIQYISTKLLFDLYKFLDGIIKKQDFYLVLLFINSTISLYTLNSLSNHFAATHFRRSPITALAVNAEPAPGPLNMNGYSLYNAV